MSSSPTSVVIGSSADSKIGVGTLLKWKGEEVNDVYFDDLLGSWIVEELLPEGGVKLYECYDVMKLEGEGMSGIEECDLKGEQS